MTEGEHGPLNPHRTTERSGHPFVDEEPRDLLHNGFEFGGNIPRGTLDFDDSTVDSTTKTLEYQLTERGISPPPLLKNYTDLRAYINDAVKAGYEVRCLAGAYENNALTNEKDIASVFMRFDLDRFITRIPSGIRERELEKAGYKRLDDTLPFHQWGDGMTSISSDADYEKATAENEDLIERIRTLESQGYHVRLVERTAKKKDRPFDMIFYIRNIDAVIDPLHRAERTLSGFTDEPPALLLQRGFIPTITATRDLSLDQDPQGIRAPVGLDEHYRFAAKKLWDEGLPHLEHYQPTENMSLSQRIIYGIRHGREIRVVPGRLDAKHSDLSTLPDSDTSVTLFSRFDLLRFMSPTDKKALPALKKDGFTHFGDIDDQGKPIIVTFPLVAWGDHIESYTPDEIKLFHIQANGIKNYILEQENDGYQVRLYPARILPSGMVDTSWPVPACTAFRRRKPMPGSGT
ncbi:MAG: hypothetical protein AAB855_01560 [Patescibacteria group bacterium]